MPLPPARPLGSPNKETFAVPFAAVGTAGNDLTTELVPLQHDGYLSAARLVPVGAATADATNKRTWSVVDQTTVVFTDGCIVDPAAAKGAYNAATAYTAGQSVAFTDGNLYVCISAVTGGTGPGVDTSHWQQIARTGLGWVNTLATTVTSDHLGAGITDSGNTDIPAASFVGAVVTSADGKATAIAITTAAPDVGQTAPPATGAIPQPTQGVVSNQATGVAVVTRTVTVEAARTLATFTCSTVSLVAGTEIDLVLSATDTKIYKGDTLKLTSVHVGTGVADPGGELVLEVTVYEEGTG